MSEILDKVKNALGCPATEEAQAETTQVENPQAGVSTPPAETFLDRMLIEQDELECKILKAIKFKLTKDFRDLKTIEKIMLDDQIDAMMKYQRLLGDRIDYYSKKQNE